VSGLTALTTLKLGWSRNLTTKGLRALSSLTALTSLELNDCRNVTSEGLCAVGSLTALTDLNLFYCDVTDRYMKAMKTSRTRGCSN
jgi:hypothetical protein